MPFHLLFLLLHMLNERSDCLTVGKEIIAAFPENIAYYHPVLAENKLRMISLHNGTKVTFKYTAFAEQTTSYTFHTYLQSGQIREYSMYTGIELDKTNISAKVVTITATNYIAVEILSLRKDSLQTALILPTDQLGMKYHIPPIHQWPLTGAEATETKNNPFKLIIVNHKDPNTISLDDTAGSSFPVEPSQVLQLEVSPDIIGKMVTGTAPFLALFGHPCAKQANCACGVLYTPLRPQSSETLTFIVPPVFSEEAEGQTYLLKSSDPEPKQFDSKSDGKYQESGPLVLLRPGLLLNLIPETEFGSCFGVYTVLSAISNWAVIVTLAASIEDVQIGNSSVESEWISVSGTDFKYTKVELKPRKNIIWHKSGLMSVWFVGKKKENSNVWFGNPAARLSIEPDFRGCLLQKEKLEVLQEELSWQEAIWACRNRGMDLISLSDQALQNHIYSQILKLKESHNLVELWMGLRRSSYSGKWYWISEDPLIHIDWSQDSPGDVHDEQCGRITLQDSKDPAWIHRHCCSKAKVLCFRPPYLLPV